MNERDRREELLERAKRGEITGEEADAEAIRLGLGSLSYTPGQSDFRPEAVSQWSLAMVLAWIAYLDLDEVRQWSLPFTEHSWHWVWRSWQSDLDEPAQEGWLLEQWPKPTVSLLHIAALDEDDDRPMSVSIRQAQESLWIMLRDGFLIASGIDTRTNSRIEIPALEWQELQPVELRMGEDAVTIRGGPYDRGYREVLLPSAIVMRYWRPPKVPSHFLPELILPDGHGYMPLFCAAQWIASEGGERSFEPGDIEVWRSAYGKLRDAIASEEVRVVGVREDQTEQLDAHLFAGIRIDYPYTDPEIGLFLSDELVLRSFPYIDEEHWFKGFDDALVNRRVDRWCRLMVAKADVRGLWPFGGTPQTKTGLPGRPALAKHLINDELHRRASLGKLEGSLAEEANALLAWLRETHPDHAVPTTRTIENNIRDAYRGLKPTK